MIKQNIFLTAFLFLTLSWQNVHAQCNTDAHSTNWKDAWTSCQTAINPNSSHNAGHWIMYDFGFVYNLTTSHIWNANEAGLTNKGLRNVIIDYSLDGTNWTNWGNFEFPQASGNNNYNGVEGPNFNELNARYILLTATTNWGHSSCYSLAEMRFNLGDAVLSVETVSYQVNCVKNQSGVVDIEWVAGNESTDGYYLIEKSQNGQDWVNVQKLDIQTSVSNKKYTFKDKEAYIGEAFYRLSKVLADGSVIDLGIQTTDCEALLAFDILPNPFPEHTLIKVHTQNAQPLVYTIRDMLGRKVEEGKVQSHNGTTQIPNIGRNLATGTYSVSIRQGNVEAVQRLVKVME